MVDAKQLQELQSKMQDTITDEQFEAMIASQPKRTRAEAEEEVEQFLQHPLNCRDLTPEAL
jgi:hypothetical protein